MQNIDNIFDIENNQNLAINEPILASPIEPYHENNP